MKARLKGSSRPSWARSAALARLSARRVDTVNPKRSNQVICQRGVPEGQQQAELGQIGRDAALGRAQSRRREWRAHLAEAQLQQEVEHLAQRLACAVLGFRYPKSTEHRNAAPGGCGLPAYLTARHD